MICPCGIRLRQWTDDIYYCPRCAAITIMGEKPRRKEGEDVEEIVKAVETLLNNKLGSAPPLRKKHTPRHTQTISQPRCDMCGGGIEDKCGAVCPSCGWIKPCGL